MKKRQSVKKAAKCFSRQIELQIFALAGVMYLLIFSVIPMFGIILAFKSYKLTSGVRIFTWNWVGLKYFVEFLQIIALANFEKYNSNQYFKNGICISGSHFFSNIDFGVP